MNIDEQHPVFSTQVSLYSNVFDQYKIDTFSIASLLHSINYLPTAFGRENVLLKVRNAKKKQLAGEITKEQYQDLKRSILSYVCFGAQFSDGKPVLDNITAYNNVIFQEIDLADNTQYSVEQIKDKITALPYVIGCWHSASQTGIHLLTHCDTSNLTLDDNHFQWKNFFYQVVNRIYTDTGLKCDKKIAFASHNSFISRDEAPHSNLQPTCLIYEPELIAYKPSEKDYTPVELDNSLFITEELQIENLKKWANYYSSMTITDKTGKPIHYTPELKYNSSEHLFKNRFSKEIISEYEYKNQNNTLGWLKKGFACYKVGFNIKTTKFLYKKPGRKKQIKAILANVYYLSHYKGRTFMTKNELYNLAFTLNGNCYDEYGKNKMPMSNEELNEITCEIHSDFEKNELQLSVSKRSTIINEDYYQNIPFSELILKGKPYFIMKEVVKMKGIIHKKLISDLMPEAEQFLIENNTKVNVTNLAKYIFNLHSDKFKNYNSVRDIITKIQKSAILLFTDRKVLNRKTKGPSKKQFCTFLKKAYESKEKVGVKLLAKISGYSERTIKKHYSPFKGEIKIHNQTIKENMKQPKMSLKQAIMKEKETSADIIPTNEVKIVKLGNITYQMQVVYDVRWFPKKTIPEPKIEPKPELEPELKVS